MIIFVGNYIVHARIIQEIYLACVSGKEAPNGITFEEINRRWKRCTNLNPYSEDLAKRTFRNWLAAIPEELGVTI